MRYILLVIVVGLVGLFCSCLQKVDNFDDINQFKKDTATIDSYIAQNNISGTRLGQGIWCVIDSASSGIRPTFQDSMIMTYKIRLLSDNSVVEESSVAVPKILSEQIDGIQIAMPYFQKGSKGRIFVPSYFAYKSGTHGLIPANANLIFEFKLINVKDAHLKSDTTAIINYLTVNSVANVMKDPSGLRFVIDSLGSGPLPGLNDSIAFKYSLKLFPGNQGYVTPYTNTPTEFALSSLILSWQIAMPRVPEGSYITLYVPSSLGYGPNSEPGIPAYSSLIFNIKLLKVISQ